uniref:Uncharacterized protein n=1 Tax=Arundo donax TaxID=35708 RepID=A0A0A9BJM3_ARUDO
MARERNGSAAEEVNSMAASTARSGLVSGSGGALDGGGAASTQNNHGGSGTPPFCCGFLFPDFSNIAAHTSMLGSWWDVAASASPTPNPFVRPQSSDRGG